MTCQKLSKSYDIIDTTFLSTMYIVMYILHRYVYVCTYIMQLSRAWNARRSQCGSERGIAYNMMRLLNNESKRVTLPSLLVSRKVVTFPSSLPNGLVSK